MFSLDVPVRDDRDLRARHSAVLLRDRTGARHRRHDISACRDGGSEEQNRVFRRAAEPSRPRSVRCGAGDQLDPAV